MSTIPEVQSIDEQIAALQAKKKELLDCKRKDALKEVRHTIQTFGFTASELGLSGGTSKKREAKYANPADPSQTWGGGAKPKWVIEHLAKGGSLDDLKIKHD